MGWTAYPGWVVGQVSTASDWNTYVEGNGNFLATPPMWKVYRNGALNTATTSTKIAFDTALFDSAGGFTSNAYTVQVAGTYFVTAALLSSSATAGHTGALRILYNSAIYTTGAYAQPTTTSPVAHSWGAQISDLVGPTAATGVIQINCISDNADPVVVGSPTDTYFSGCKFSN